MPTMRRLSCCCTLTGVVEGCDGDTLTAYGWAIAPYTWRTTTGDSYWIDGPQNNPYSIWEIWGLYGGGGYTSPDWGVLVTATRGGVTVGSAYTGADGSYAIPICGNGTYVLTYTSPIYCTTSQTVVVTGCPGTVTVPTVELQLAFLSFILVEACSYPFPQSEWVYMNGMACAITSPDGSIVYSTGTTGLGIPDSNGFVSYGAVTLYVPCDAPWIFSVTGNPISGYPTAQANLYPGTVDGSGNPIGTNTGSLCSPVIVPVPLPVAQNVPLAAFCWPCCPATQFGPLSLSITIEITGNDSMYDQVDSASFTATLDVYYVSGAGQDALYELYGTLDGSDLPSQIGFYSDACGLTITSVSGLVLLTGLIVNADWLDGVGAGTLTGGGLHVPFVSCSPLLMCGVFSTIAYNINGGCPTCPDPPEYYAGAPWGYGGGGAYTLVMTITVTN